MCQRSSVHGGEWYALSETSLEPLAHGSVPDQCRAACMAKSPPRGPARLGTTGGTCLGSFVSASTKLLRESELPTM